MSELSGEGIANSSLSILKSLKNTELGIEVIVVDQEMDVGALAALGPGSQLYFDKSAKEPVKMKVNGTDFANGFVVQSDGHYGVRVETILE
jgi:flagellar motor switch/type III secretory pathway protein FliN